MTIATRHPMSRAVLVGFGIAAALSLPGDAFAQAVRLRVVEEGSGVPIAGAIVELRRTTGATESVVAVSALTAQDGGLFMTASAGTYRVHLRRIGYRPHTSEPFTVATETVDLRISMPAVPVTLPSLIVAGEQRCRGTGRTGDAAVASVWEEVRTALTATELSRRGRVGALQARAFERRYDAQRRLRRELIQPPSAVAARPFESRPPAELSTEGFIRTPRDGPTSYFAPDEHVLLSDEFARDHCFSLVAGSLGTAGLIGVAFEPDPRRRVPDIGGTLWVDSATAELRHLDFWFVDSRLPREALGPDGAGGQIVFERLEDGRWIVSAWRLRMPMLAPEEPATVQSSIRTMRPTSGRLVLAEFVEVGAVVERSGVGLLDRALSLAIVLAPYRALTIPAQVHGAVFDSTRGTPLSGALVRLDVVEEADWSPENAALLLRRPTDRRIYSTIADDQGRYLLDSVPAGSYRLSLARPATGELEWSIAVALLRLKPSELLEQPLVVRGATAAAVTGDTAPGRRTPVAFVSGVIKDSSGRPLGHATVSVRAAGADTMPIIASIRTDAAGRFRLPVSASGRHLVTVQQIGYRPGRWFVELRPGRTLILRETLESVQVLETVTVEGRAYNKQLLDLGFYRRQRSQAGRFLDAEFMEHFGGWGLSALIAETARLSIVRDGPRAFAFGRVGGYRCRMNVFVDGVFQRAAIPVLGQGLGLDEIVPRDEILAVEIYPSATNLPSEFVRIGPNAGSQGRAAASIPSPGQRPPGSANHSAAENQDANCGAIVIWTKRFSDPSGGW